jgi:hypothetical protein
MVAPLEFMMKIHAVSLYCLVLTLLCFEAAGDDREQDKKKKPYASAAADCDKAISGRKSELAESYSSEVWGLKQRFQNDGDLEKALAADKEWSRSIRREPLTPDDLVESPKELRILQDAYVERQDCVEQEVAADVVRELEREAKELAQAGNLTDGRVLQQEIDKIKRLYLTNAKKTATEPKGTKQGKAAPGEPEDPVLACEEAIRQKRVAIQAQYVGELEALEKSFQAKGALEDLFAAKAERERFMATPLLALQNLVDKPEALRELQQKYLELQNNVATAVAEEFVSRLEQQKQAMTIDGNLDGALQAKKDAEKIQQRYQQSPAGVEHNVALNRPTTQSSTYSVTGFNHAASLGVDGVRGPLPQPQGLVMTNKDNAPWWQVDLQDIYSLPRLVIWNRVDCCQERLRTVEVLVSRDGDAWEKCYSHGGKPVGDKLAVDLKCRKARYVRLQIKEPVNLHFYECEVFGK